ncbi:hypothetical protein [Streptomyces sp. Ac-502]|uniref:hypothetical protein n=1 Tax=Streptomyces sp. Ac-502 TaxID=3342801 RepID=UPI0038626A72
MTPRTAVQSRTTKPLYAVGAGGVMTRVEEQLTIGCTAEAFLGFVMDVERYAQVDDKLRTVFWVRRDGDLTEFAFRPALPGVPFPQPKAVARMRLTPGRRIDIRLAPCP